MSDPQRFFEFDNFLLDAQQRLLFRDGQPVELTPKVFDVLFELVQSGGRVIEKKELMEKVWPNSFVEEANLTQHVSTLRKKLGHDARQRYILTVPGRGYRFAAAIKGWDDDAIVTVEERVRSRITVGQPETPGETGEIIPAMHRVLPAVAEKRSRRWILIATGIGIILIGVVALSLVNALRRRPAPFTSIRLSKFTTDGRVSSAAISPNGKQVAYAEEADDGQQTLWLRQVATSNTGVVVAGPTRLSFEALTFSPDSDYSLTVLLIHTVALARCRDREQNLKPFKGFQS